MENIVVLTPNFILYNFEVQEHIQNGYEIDAENPPALFMGQYECHLVRKTVRADKAPAGRPPKTK